MPQTRADKDSPEVARIIAAISGKVKGDKKREVEADLRDSLDKARNFKEKDIVDYYNLELRKITLEHSASRLSADSAIKNISKLKGVLSGGLISRLISQSVSSATVPHDIFLQERMHLIAKNISKKIRDN